MRCGLLGGRSGGREGEPRLDATVRPHLGLGVARRRAVPALVLPGWLLDLLGLRLHPHSSGLRKPPTPDNSTTLWRGTLGFLVRSHQDGNGMKPNFLIIGAGKAGTTSLHRGFARATYSLAEAGNDDLEVSVAQRVACGDAESCGCGRCEIQCEFVRVG